MAQKPKRGTGMPLPPAPPEGGPDDQDYVYMSPGEQQAVQPYYGLPLMTPEMRRYRVGGRQMMDPRNFEYIQRKREEARTQGTRLKKGGPVKKYQKGGAVEDGKDKYPSERRMLEKGLARTRQRRADMDTELDPTGDREAVMSAPFQVQRPSAFYPLTGRDYVGPRQQMDRERARREAEVQRRVDVARRSLDDRMSTMESSLSEMGTKENKQNYRKGGAVKKAAGGKVEIEIKVGGKGMHKMPDGSMMEDEEHEAEEYRKGGRIRKYAQGGEVGNSDRPEERGPVGLYYNRLLRDRRANKAREKEFEPDLRSEQIVLGAKKAARGPSAGGPERLAREAAEDATRRRNRTAFYQGIERELEGMLDREGARIGQRRDPTRVEDNGYKKGGKVAAKTPVKKAMGGKVAAKPMGKPVMKKAGGRVAAKPMMKGRKK